MKPLPPEFWHKHFLGFEKRWAPPWNLEHQSDRPESFALVLDRVLFVGVTNPAHRGSTAIDWQQIDAQNLAWTTMNFAAVKAEVRSAVVLAHAGLPGPSLRASGPRPTPSLSRSCTSRATVTTSSARKTPAWEANVVQVQVDSGGKPGDPLKVTVTGDDQDPFVLERPGVGTTRTASRP